MHLVDVVLAVEHARKVRALLCTGLVSAADTGLVTEAQLDVALAVEYAEEMRAC
jgi:hypothetical protein